MHAEARDYHDRPIRSPSPTYKRRKMDPSASTFTPITFDASHIPSDADLHGHPRAYPATDATESFVRTDYTIGIMPAGDLAPVAPAPLQIKLLQDTARTPTRGSRFAAGYDLYASDPKLVPARGRSLVSTGIAVAVPEGTCTLTTTATNCWLCTLIAHCNRRRPCCPPLGPCSQAWHLDGCRRHRCRLSRRGLRAAVQSLRHRLQYCRW